MRCSAGTEVCRVPKEVCLRRDQGRTRQDEVRVIGLCVPIPWITSVCIDGSFSEFQPSQDSQMHLAIKFMSETRRGKESPLWPKLQTFPQTVGVAWMWSSKERDWLKDTELGQIVERKRERLEREFKAEVEPRKEGWTLEEYFDACSSIISHANPWFGVSSVILFAILHPSSHSRANDNFQN